MTIYEDLAPAATSDQIKAKLRELQQWLLGKYPLLDTADPVLVSVWLGPLSQRLVEQSNLISSIETYGQLSISVLNGLTTDAERSQLQLALATSLGIGATAASRALGEVRITTGSDDSIVVPAGAQFTAGGLLFTATTAYILRSPSKLTGSPSERPLRQLIDGTWVGEVSLIASLPGSAANISAGSSFVADLNVSNLIGITAVENFIGGRDANSLQDLLTKFTNGFTAKTLGSRDQIVAFLLGRDDIVPLQQLGVIGFGDVEMQRDKLAFYPVGGGKADIYVASQQYPTSQTVVVEAQATRIADGPTKFSIGLSRDRAPGYLRVLSIVDDLSGEALTIESEARGVDTSPIYGELVPTIAIAKHGTFSRFQTSAIVATGPSELIDANATVTRSVSVRLQRIPTLSDIQTLVSGRTYRFVGGDTLIRAAAPVFMRIGIRLQTVFQQALPNADAIRAAVADEISRRPMRPSIYQADIVQAIARLLPPDVNVTEVVFDGELINFEGQVKRYHGVNSLDLPNSPGEQLTPRTVAMYIAATDVNVSIEQKLTYHTP
jgi:hypothetical protein